MEYLHNQQRLSNREW